MFASPLYSYRPIRAVKFKNVAPFLRYLNTSTLAFALVVALAVLTSIRGTGPEANCLAVAKDGRTEVVIDNYAFSPAILTVPSGATVTWTNHDSVPHVVASAGDQFKKSPVLKTGQRFSNTFATAGTYSYLCSIHPRMTGKIVVK